MHVFAERVSEVITSTSTSTITLGGAIGVTYNRFVDRFADGQTNISVCVEDDSAWLTGLYTLTDANTLTRTAIIDSSADGADVTLSSTIRTATCVLTAHRAAQFVSVDATATSTIVDPAAMTILVIEGGVAKQITVADFLAAMGINTASLPSASVLADANGIVVVQSGAEVLTTLGTLKTYMGGTDTTAPTAVSAAVANATPARVDITMSEPLNASYLPAASSVTIGGHTVSSLAISNNVLQVTVSSAFVYGEAARTAAYTQPGTNNLRDAAGNLLANFSGLAITNSVADTTAPTASSAAVANATPTVVAITMSEAMDGNYVPAASAFTVGGHTVSSVAISGSTINLTVSAAFVNGEAARTVGYAQPGTNNARDVAGNLLASFSGLSITNNVQPTDTTAPTFVSAQVANAAPANIVITMSETLAAVTPATSAFTASGGKTVTGVAVSGSTVTVTVNSAYVNGDTITITYTKPGSSALQDAAGNQTATFGPSSVTNNVAPADTTAPTFVSALVADANRNIIVMTMSETMANVAPATSAFTVSGGKTVSSVSISGATVNVTVSSNYAYGDAITVAYTKPGSGNTLQDPTGNATATFGAQSVTNNIINSDTTAPTFTSAAIAQGSPTIITVTMSEALGSEVPQASAFTVTGAGMGTTVSSVGTPSGSTFALTLSAAVEAGSVVTLAYNKPGSGNQIKDAAGNAAATWSAQSVTNNQTTTTYTLSGYNGNTLVSSINGASPTTTQGSLKGFDYLKQSSGQYWSASPSPASMRCGWSQSSTVPPEIVSDNQHINAASSVNGLAPMQKPGQFNNDNYLWVATGSGTSSWYFWLKPIDGVPQCMNPSSPVSVTGA
jgi:uncharacterized repeat protein (TIGR02059 family)